MRKKDKVVVLSKDFEKLSDIRKDLVLVTAKKLLGVQRADAAVLAPGNGPCGRAKVDV